MLESYKPMMTVYGHLKIVKSYIHLSTFKIYKNGPSRII